MRWVGGRLDCGGGGGKHPTEEHPQVKLITWLLTKIYRSITTDHNYWHHTSARLRQLDSMLLEPHTAQNRENVQGQCNMQDLSRERVPVLTCRGMRSC
eukprot:5553168-Amphidinium_carterae.1